MSKHGPYYVILNQDRSLWCDKMGDPHVFKTMGPHDNHTKHKRTVERAHIVVLDEAERDQSVMRGEEVRNPLFDVLDRADLDSVSDAQLGSMIRAYKNEIRAKSIGEDAVRCTSLKVDAEIGKQFDMSARFEGEGVKLFAAHLVEWFRTQGGQNFVTVEVIDPESGDRFELTMQRAGAKTPAQALVEMRTELEALRGRS